MRITRLRLRDLKVHRDLDLELAPGLTVVRGPERGGQDDAPAGARAGALPEGHGERGGDRRASAAGEPATTGGPGSRWTSSRRIPRGRGEGSLEKDFRGAKGTRPAGPRRRDRDRPGPRRRDPRRPHRDPQREVLPLHRLGPPPRGRSTSPATRGRCATGCRRRSAAPTAGTSVAKRRLDRALRELQASGERNPGRLRVAEEAVARSEAIVAQGEAQLAQLERDRDALVGAREPPRRRRARPRASAARCWRRPARPSGSSRSARWRRSASSATARRWPSPARSPSSRGATRPRNPLPVLRQIVERHAGPRPRDRRAARPARRGALRRRLRGRASRSRATVRSPGWRSPGRRRAWPPSRSASSPASSPRSSRASSPPSSGVVLAAYARARRTAAFDFRRQKQLRDDEIARRLRGRSQLEDDLRRAEADLQAQLATIEVDDPAAAEDLLAREDAHVQAIERGAGPARRARRQGAGRDAARPCATRRPSRSSRRRRPSRRLGPDRQGAARPRAPRGRGPRPGRAPWSGPATTRPAPAPGSSRTRWTRSRSPARPSVSPRRASSWPPSSAASGSTRRALDAIQRAETATMRTATRYLEKRMRGDLARLTGGRYRRVAVDDATLDISRLRARAGRLGSRSRTSPRARSTSATSRRASGSSGSSPRTGGRRWSSTTRS